MDFAELISSDRFTYALVVLTLIAFTTTALSVTGALSVSMNDVSKQKAGELISDTLATSTGSSYEVVNVKEESGLYKVDLNVQNQLQTVYVTKDAELFTTSMNSLSQLRETLETQRKTESCLNDKNTTFYGNITQQETQLQIQVMGGTNRVDGYYKDVNQQGVLQEAVDRGVRAIPAFVVDGEVLQGVNNISEVREFAGCTN